MKDKNKKVFLVVIIVILLIVIGSETIYFMTKTTNTITKKENYTEIDSEDKKSPYYISSNSLEPFDLYFLQLENQKENKIYSPLSLKYALAMLASGTSGNSKNQITHILGDYQSKKYINSNNMALANALFIKDTYKDNIKNSYVDTISSKYNAEIVYDSFKSAEKFNKWVSNKTLGLIDNLKDDINNNDFILVNALGIDMEWQKKIQSEYEDYYISYDHRNYYKVVDSLQTSYKAGLSFEGFNKEAYTLEIGATINKYDIISTLGEANIRSTVKADYQKWLDEGAPSSCTSLEEEPDAETYVNEYMKELSVGYKDISSSTDFSFYITDDVKVFAKDLKTYNNTTLQYVGIMPINESLDNYISNVKPDTINDLISNLKGIELNNFKEGVITDITGYIPTFNFEYQLNLIEDLKSLGVTDIFNPQKANLSNLTTDNAFISDTTHKANISFTNDGIKASAATMLGGKGAGSCGYDYIYDVPVEKIDLTFNRPYLFMIRDKETGEVWFIGTVYEPNEYDETIYESMY